MSANINLEKNIYKRLWSKECNCGKYPYNPQAGSTFGVNGKGKNTIHRHSEGTE